MRIVVDILPHLGAAEIRSWAEWGVGPVVAVEIDAVANLWQRESVEVDQQTIHFRMILVSENMVVNHIKDHGDLLCVARPDELLEFPGRAIRGLDGK